MASFGRDAGRFDSSAESGDESGGPSLDARRPLGVAQALHSGTHAQELRSADSVADNVAESLADSVADSVADNGTR